jgi:protein-tyrosine phosphatase
VAWLIFLGPFFFATYGFANWLASRRAHVGAIAYGWEHRIPFVPWTIVPYWSIDLLYAVSVLIGTTRREVDRHAQRLLAVQVISIACFLAFPLRFSFDRPVASGVFGALFTALGSFDKPFNQAPSLHIALLVVIWVRLAAHVSSPKLHTVAEERGRPGRRVPGRLAPASLRGSGEAPDDPAGGDARAPLRWLLHTWMALIGLSILTTYQHHFIDLPTGMLVGFLALWALPDEGPSPLAQWSLTKDRARRRLARRYALGALVCVAPAFLGGAWLWMLWPAIALALVALNYALFGAHGFQKHEGRLSIGAYGLLAPYVAGAWLNSRLWTRNHPRPAEVIDGVFLGRIPADSDLTDFAAVVDLSAELPCGSRPSLHYRGFPVLDLTVPDAASLHDAAVAIEEARTHGPVLVCCALGYSRSAAAIVAWLLTTHRATSVDEAMRLVQKARPSIVLRGEHCAALEAFA